VNRNLLLLQSIDVDIARLRRELNSIVPDGNGIELHNGTSRRIEQLEAQRIKVSLRIPKDLLSSYDLRKKVIKAPWVARLEKQACASCQARLPTRMVFELLSQGVARPCPGCSRLVVSAD
jgi:predicted  nucleic acid-binding Zn-ribbon protein